MLKTGLVFADAINTVSPRYAEEITTTAFGCGLEGVLQHRREVLSGILNGVDYSQWNPAIDPHLAAKYDLANVREGKRPTRRPCLAELGLTRDLGVAADRVCRPAGRAKGDRSAWCK